MTETPELSVVVPSYNEERRLARSLERIVGYLTARGTTFEILVVDDGSTDRTAEVVEGFSAPAVSLIRHPRQLGKGAAVKTGMRAARGAWVLLTDADLAAPIEDLAKLEARRDGAAVVVGSRAVADSVIEPRQPLPRELMGKCFNVILRLLGLTRLHDTQCGFKLLEGDLARRLGAEIEMEGFAFDVEMLWRARRTGAEVVEVGVRWGHASQSKVRLTSDPIRMLLDVVRFRWRTLHRSYVERASRPG